MHVEVDDCSKYLYATQMEHTFILIIIIASHAQLAYMN